MSQERPSPATRGASSSYTGYGDIIRAWRAHHARSANDAMRRLLKSPLQTLMTGLVVAIALALPATLLLAVQNIERLGERWDASPKLSVFLHLRASDNAIEPFIAKVRSWPEIAELRYLSPTEALAEFQTQSGFSDALKGLDHNPLPPTMIVTPKAGAMAPESLAGLAARLQAEPLVDTVDLDLAWVRRLQAIMALGRQLVLGLAVLLGLGALLAIGNTVRLGIESRRDEIIVTKLVGGTDSFVRRPLLYTGIWYGLVGGLLAAIIVLIGFSALKGSVARLAATYASEFALQGLGVSELLSLVATGMAIGLLGAWLAVGRHLRHIEPR